MGQFWDQIPDSLKEWALQQQVFFTASAPLVGRHVNVSPKGLPSATFCIFGPNSAGYVDGTGSGAETISHVYENGRVTIMFCSFAKSPRILRFFCRGSVVEWDSPKFEPLIQKMGKQHIEGARAVILLDVFKVQTSCGFGVPSSPKPFINQRSHADLSDTTQLLTTAPNPDDPEKIEPVLLDRDTMGHWCQKKIEKNALLSWQAEWNSSSLDGCPGIRAAMRDNKETVWFSLARARARRMSQQTEAVGFGMLLGVLFMLLVQLCKEWSALR